MVLLGIIVTTWEIKIIYVHANGSLFILSLNVGAVILLVVPIILSPT